MNAASDLTANADANTANLPAEDLSDSSDWEYEYDDHETETYFVTVDLSTHHPESNKRLKLSFEQINSSRTSAVPSSPHQVNEHGAGRGGSAPFSSKNKAPQKPQPSRMQILDFHGRNPIISYQNQAYSCHWTEAIGTDLIFEPKQADKILGERAPGAAATLQDDNDVPQEVAIAPELALEAPGQANIAHREAVVKPLRSYTTFDLLATTSARLVGTPVKLVAREGPVEDSSNSRAPTETKSTAKALRTSTISGPNQDDRLTARQAQSDFLARLAAIKSARGETDIVPLVGPKSRLKKVRGISSENGQLSGEDDDSTAEEASTVEGVEASITISDSDRDEEDASRDTLQNTARRRTAKRQRGARRGRKQWRGAPMGLFRDYVPREGDDPGAEYRPPNAQDSNEARTTAMTFTPASWDGLEKH